MTLDLATPAIAAWCFLPVALPISLWVAWSDLKFMKIPNLAVAALMLIFVLIGPFVFSGSEYLWRLAQMGILLVIGFLASTARLFGAGDAKFAAAMAPFIAVADLQLFLPLFAATLLGGLMAHRGLKYIKRFRASTSDWVSWQRRDYPMGLSLAGALCLYLGLAAVLPG